MDGQLSFATLDYACKKKRTKRDVFLAEMAVAVPWSVLEAVIAPWSKLELSPPHARAYYSRRPGRTRPVSPDHGSALFASAPVPT